MSELRPALGLFLARLLVHGYPNAPRSDADRGLWVDTMAELLTGITEADLGAAMRAFLLSTDPQDRYMPTAGRLLALTPTRSAIERAALDAGAWYHRVMLARGAIGPDADGLDKMLTGMGRSPSPPSPPVVEAIRAAVATMGGWMALGAVEVADRGEVRRWEASFRAALIDPAAVQRAIGVAQDPRQIGAA